MMVMESSDGVTNWNDCAPLASKTGHRSRGVRRFVYRCTQFSRSTGAQRVDGAVHARVTVFTRYRKTLIGVPKPGWVDPWDTSQQRFG
jgi:hypothetical protein